MRLSAAAKTQPEDTTRTDGDGGLDDVVAGAERINAWVEEANETVALIRLQQIYDKR